jgi:hypothetical protein
MAGDVVNIKVCSPLKLNNGLTGNYHAICHYSYNLPLPASRKKNFSTTTYNPIERKREKTTLRTSFVDRYSAKLKHR